MGCHVKVELALIGIVLVALIGYLVGAILEHPPGPGGLSILGALIGAMLGLTILVLGEALKESKKPITDGRGGNRV